MFMSIISPCADDPRPCAQREAQAKVISQIVKENSHAEVTNYDGIGQADVCSDQVEMEREFPYHLLNITWTREAIVLGDFNDLDPRIPDRNNNIPRSRTLEIMRETGLRSVGKFTEQKDRWTWGDKGSEDPRESMIDHIFVSPGLFEKVRSSALENMSDNLIFRALHVPFIMCSWNLLISHGRMK